MADVKIEGASKIQGAALEYWQAWLDYESRMSYNPFPEFAAKITALPLNLREVATQAFVESLDFSKIPDLVRYNTARSLRAVKVLCILATGEDTITQENFSEAFPLLIQLVGE